VSDDVAMPPDNVSEDADVHLATIPLHLSFQRLLGLFRASNGAPLADIISEFQKRALSKEERGLLKAEEREILRAMDFSLLEIAAARRVFLDQADSAPLRKHSDTVHRFGPSSPSRGLGESSWS
jgi:hypothetical protein